MESSASFTGGTRTTSGRDTATGYLIGNTLKTAALLGGIGGLMVLVGMWLGGGTGATIALVLAFGVSAGSYWFSDRLALRAAGAVEVSEAEAPNLHRIVRGLTQRADLPMPRVCLIDQDQPNAFATGRNPRHAAVAVTRGLLEICDEREVAGVLAHELGHVKHRDILISSVAGAVATAISYLAQMALWSGMMGGRRRDDEGGGNAVVMLLLAVLAPAAAMILQLALSRSREFEADREGAQILGDPRPLASALRKLEVSAQRIPADVLPSQASAYIVNPLSGRKVAFGNLFRTHPPTEERVQRLLAMA